MNRTLLALFFASVALPIVAEGPADPALRERLLELLMDDQNVRLWVIQQTAPGRPEDPVSPALIESVERVDRSNAGKLQSIIDQYGWPSAATVGEDGMEAVFVIVQHADHDPAFQARCLAAAEQAYRSREMDGETFALLIDRTRVNAGRPQLYGTQVRVIDGHLEALPIEDAGNVDSRREGLGLTPLSKHLDDMRRTYGLLR
ncbi:MAG TPA: DUF6624 domain-containing protein [Thermoanaerobaculia bacterium]|nr:DUF6624 domain-containing protein [Thermoanaerobaculia bacterium]